MDSIFTTQFLDSVKSVLDERCPVGSGQCVTRAKLAEALGVDPKFRLEGALGVLVASGVVAGYEVRKGPNGGIGRAGEHPEPKPSVALGPELSQEFKYNLMAALQKLCDVNGAPVSRQSIADYLELPKSPPLISAALQLEEFAEFETKIGKGGGVRRVVSPVGDALVASADESTAVAV